jgi:hypothetical protein
MRNRPFDDLVAKLAAAAQPPTDAKQAKVRLRDNVKLHPLTVAKAEQTAQEQKTARRRKPVRRNPPAVKASMTVRIAEEVMETALRLADGDMSRIELQPDGSAIVWNHPRGSTGASGASGASGAGGIGR